MSDWPALPSDPSPTGLQSEPTEIDPCYRAYQQGIDPWKQPSVAPLPERDDHREQVFTLLSENIFLTLGVACDWPPFKNAAVDELLETRRQETAGDSDPLLEIIKAAGTGECLAYDEQTSPFPDQINRTRHGAIGVSPAISLHSNLITKNTRDSKSYLAAAAQ